MSKHLPMPSCLPVITIGTRTVSNSFGGRALSLLSPALKRIIFLIAVKRSMHCMPTSIHRENAELNLKWSKDKRERTSQVRLAPSSCTQQLRADSGGEASCTPWPPPQTALSYDKLNKECVYSTNQTVTFTLSGKIQQSVSCNASCYIFHPGFHLIFFSVRAKTLTAKPSMSIQRGSGKAMPLLPLGREGLLLHVTVAQGGRVSQEGGLGQPKPAFSGAARTGLGCQVGWWRALAVTQQVAAWERTLHESCSSSGHLQGNRQTGLVPFLLPECTLCQQQQIGK